MKVVAVTQKNYIVEISVREMEKLTGSGGGWTNPDAGNIGRELDIISAWNAIYSLDAHKTELPKIANKLRALADLLVPIKAEIPIVKDEK